jgi:hypothetical protein
VIDVLVELVAVTVAVTVSGIASLQERTDVLLMPKVMLVGFNEHVALPVTVSKRSTVPVSPFRDATVMVEAARLFTSPVILTGLALRLIPGPAPA